MINVWWNDVRPVRKWELLLQTVRMMWCNMLGCLELWKNYAYLQISNFLWNA